MENELKMYYTFFFPNFFKNDNLDILMPFHNLIRDEIRMYDIEMLESNKFRWTLFDQFGRLKVQYHVGSISDKTPQEERDPLWEKCKICNEFRQFLVTYNENKIESLNYFLKLIHKS